MATVTVDRSDDLGPALRDVRLELGLTQTALADEAEVGRQWLNAFEAGDKGSAPLDLVMRVIDALDVTVTLTPRRPPRPVDDTEEPVDLDALIESFRQA